jgi:hypothetical protein
LPKHTHTHTHTHTEEEGSVKAKAINEVDAGRDRATPSVRKDYDKPLTLISPCYCKRAARPADYMKC